MKLLNLSERALVSRIVLICVAALLLTGTSVATRPTHAFVIEFTFAEKVVIQSLIATARYFFGRNRGPERRGKNFVEMQVPQSVVGSAEAQRQVQCMVDTINALVRANPDGWLGGKFNGKDAQKVVLKRGKLNRAHGQADIENGEIIIDLEAINAYPDTNDPSLNVALTVFHELWHIANPQYPGHRAGTGIPETEPAYWLQRGDDDFGPNQNRAWKKVFGDFHPLYKVAINGKSRTKDALIRPGTACFWQASARKKRMHGR